MEGVLRSLLLTTFLTMSNTIQNIVDRALEKAGIKDPGQDAETEDQTTAIDELNDMMLEWHQDGVWANYTPASVITDTNTAYGWMKGAMKNFLSLRLMAEYQRPIPPSIAAFAAKQWQIILNHFNENREMGYPDTMLIGSGNSYGYAGRYEGFPYYNEDQDDFLSVGGGTLTNGRGQPIQDGPTSVLNADTNTNR